MPTFKQQNLAREIIANVKRKKPKNKKELLVSAGYDETTATATPGDIIEQKGVKEALKDLGFTEDNAKKVVTEILLDTKQKGDTRINAAKEVFKVHGSYKDTETGNKTLILVVSGESAQRYNVKPNESIDN